MKHRCRLPLTVIVAGTLAQAQDIVLDADYRAHIVAKANQLLIGNYVFPDVAQQAAAAVSAHLQNGDYNGITSAAAFADRLTRDYNSVAHDKHLGVHYTYQAFAPGTGGGGPEIPRWRTN
jgi:hypothetical protein